MAPPDSGCDRGGVASGLAPRLAGLLLALALACAALEAGQRAAADDYSDTTLEAFVEAAIQVSRRIEEWRPLIEGTTDEDARAALIESATAEIARAIEDADGIDEDEYYAIYTAAREDEALRARIDGILAAWLQRQRVPRAE